MTSNKVKYEKIHKLVGKGQSVVDACAKFNVNKGNYYFWRSKQAGADKVKIVTHNASATGPRKYAKSKKNKNFNITSNVALIVGSPEDVAAAYKLLM